MKFHVTRSTLSDDCKECISKDFAERDIDVDSHKLFDRINSTLEFYVADQAKKKNAKSPTSKQIRREVLGLVKAFEKLHDETLDVLDQAYMIAYPLPPPYSRADFEENARRSLIRQMHHQSEKTHIMQIDWKDMDVFPVHLYDLVERIRKACEVMQRGWKPRKGQPEDHGRITFAMSMYLHFDMATGVKATSSPGDAFDIFLGHILNDVAGEDEGACHSKLIDSVLKIISFGPLGYQILEARTAFVRRHGEEAARSFFESRPIPPYPIHWLSFLRGEDWRPEEL